MLQPSSSTEATGLGAGQHLAEERLVGRYEVGATIARHVLGPELPGPQALL